MCLSSSSSSINLSSVYHLSIIYLSSIDLLSIIYLCIICHLLVSHCTHHTRRPHACTWAHMCAHSRGHTWGSPPCRELTPGALPVTSTPASSPHFPPPFFPRSSRRESLISRPKLHAHPPLHSEDAHPFPGLSLSPSAGDTPAGPLRSSCSNVALVKWGPNS